MVQVKFNQPDEFCAEMQKDHHKIERKIVRTTLQYQTSSMSPNIHHVFALASYSVEGQVVTMEKYCGDIWRINGESDKKVLDKAGDNLNAIEARAESLGLEIRSGQIQE